MIFKSSDLSFHKALFMLVSSLGQMLSLNFFHNLTNEAASVMTVIGFSACSSIGMKAVAMQHSPISSTWHELNGNFRSLSFRVREKNDTICLVLPLT